MESDDLEMGRLFCFKMEPKPVPTTAPSVYGLQSYAPMSSMSNPYASNYQAPMSSSSGQLNAYGSSLYSSNPYGTVERVVKTDPLIGTFSPTPGPAPAPTNSFDDIYNKYYQGWGRTEAERDYAANPNKFSGTQSSGPSYEDIMRSQIDSGYNDYFGQLDAMMGGLGDQRASQDALISSQFSGGLTDLGLQKQQNLNELGTQERKAEESQVKTLKDISSNIRNLQQAGNTYLGSRGAGDSSAVNQYAYALTKLGSQQRGDVMGQTRQIMSEIDDRKSRLDNTFLQEKNKLTMSRDEAVQGVATWFADAQNQLRQAKAQGMLSKSQDLQALTTNLYNQAVQQLANIQNQAAQKQAQLESWALNNSKSLAEAKANLAGIAQYSAPTQSYSAISGTPRFDQQGNMGVDFRGGVGTGFGLTEDQKRLLGLA